jgi:calcium-dependent protein kinase
LYKLISFFHLSVLNGSYDERCDLFSVGVVAYVLLSGTKPFWGTNKKMSWKERRVVMIDLIKRCDYSPMTGRDWKDVTNTAKDFVRSLLQLNPDDRPTAKEALLSPWIRENCCESNEDVQNCLALSIGGEEALDQVSSTRYGLWSLLSSKLDEDEVVGLQAYVESLDEDGHCSISFDTLYSVLCEATNCNKEELDAVFECDSTSRINYVDFFAEVLNGIGRNRVEQLAAALDSLDVDGTRKLKSADARDVVERILPVDLSAAVWSSMKFDDNGMVVTSEILSDVTERYAGRHRDSIRSGGCKS